MRVHGTLIKWNDDRGFGFIRPAKGDSEIFVHISAFPKDGVRPTVQELISFEVEVGKDGRQRAVRVMRPGHRPVPQRTRAPRQIRSRHLWRNIVIGGLLVVGLGQYIHSRFTNAPSSAPFYDSDASVEHDSDGLVEEETSPRFHCDGRTRCTEMTSCAEATYFIRNCPNTRMDGDNDGVPCEDQHCRY